MRGCWTVGLLKVWGEGVFTWMAEEEESNGAEVKDGMSTLLG